VANQVTLTFAGETKPLEQGFDRVGKSAEQMTVRVTEGVNETAEKFDYLSSQSSLLSGGIGDVGGALTEAFGENNPIGAFGAQMEKASAIIMGFTGLADLAVFATNNFKIATLAKAGADRVAAAAQWVMNSALLASPITWIIVAIVALIAVVVLIATKTDWFSKAWRASWGWIKSAAGAVGSWFKDTLWGKWIKGAWDGMVNKGVQVVLWFRKVPGQLKTAFASVKDFLFAPFRAAFNLISSAWNNTIGRLSWSVPSWIPGIGGNSISVPNLPHFHAGGVVPGVVGTPQVAVLQAGEKVGSVASSGDGGGWVAIRGDAVLEPLVKAIALKISDGGGRAAQLGIRVL
jgi:hypothetical protein